MYWDLPAAIVKTVSLFFFTCILFVCFVCVKACCLFVGLDNYCGNLVCHSLGYIDI